jgi:hypothetical protein
MVAGFVATAWNGTTNGVVGVASRNVRLVPLKGTVDIYDISLGMGVSNTIAAIGYATSNYNNINTRIRILNLSSAWYRYDIQSPHFNTPLFVGNGLNSMRQAIINYPGLLVAAAGNYGEDNNWSNPAYPASFNLPNVISVGAVDREEQRSVWLYESSNRGNNSVHLHAPGGRTQTDTNIQINMLTTGHW